MQETLEVQLLGVWLVQISNRGSAPTINVTTLKQQNSGTVTFGYYKDTTNGFFYFGVYTSAYRADTTITILRNTGVTLQNFGNTTSQPSGWTAVTSREVLGKVNLYENNSGTTGTVTLSETSANFSYLEIFFSEKNYSTTGFKHEKVFAPNGKQVILSWSTHDDGVIIFRSARYSISGTSITRVSETQYNTWNKTAQKVTETSIFKVVGYR